MIKQKIPISFTGRKYGYITWIKKNDPQIKILFGTRKYVDFKTNTIRLKKKKIDWKKRRIGITYSITRNLPVEIEFFIITKQDDGCYHLEFK
jgi:hypothetical protein